ncbi:MAG TPA: TetR/AcrR family transcriptional regulator [Gemmatimonadaceae bacterium]|nr:TetR/AcrR family transcriptional regulator [Gemmatimonadaceae bacterium]
MLTHVNSLDGAARVKAAAHRVLARDGLAALSMRNVATEAGVTATAIYRHFKDKDELLRTIIRERYETFLQYLAEAAPAKRPFERLLAALDRYADFAIDHPTSYELLFVSPHGISIDRYPADFNSGRSRGFRQLRLLVEECIDAGEIRDGDATDIALGMYAHAHGIVMLHRAGRFGGRNDVMRRFFRRSLSRLA